MYIILHVGIIILLEWQILGKDKIIVKKMLKENIELKYEVSLMR